MSSIAVIQFTNLFLAGLLAGEELVVCYGVRAAMATLADIPQTQLRQALIRRLRVLVPAIFLPAAVSCIMTAGLAGHGPGFGFICAGLLALLAWAGITFAGTVPINKGVLEWQAERLPPDWKSTIVQWERLDMLRCWAAVISFACLLIAVALRTSLGK
jgi:uncharacterized membrane protein